MARKRPLSMKFMARYQRARRRKFKRAGKCPECGSDPIPGQKKCKRCTDYQRQWYQDNESRPRAKAS